MAQFIKYRDIETDSNVIVNKNQIQEVRVRRSNLHGGHEYYEIKFVNGKIVNVREPVPMLNANLEEPLFTLNED